MECPAGATCTVPASPELVIGHDAVLERRESEVTEPVDQAGEVVGSIEYTLKLSVEPTAEVHVVVTKETEANGTHLSPTTPHTHIPSYQSLS
jgi:hypothetical protein